MHNTTSTKRVICRRCSGNGIISVATRDKDKCRDEPCPFCIGIGMMLQTVTVKYEVIKNPK